MVPNLTQAMVWKYGSNRLRIAPRVLHISKFSWGRTPNPPQREVITHEFSHHHEISNPPFQNPMYSHSGLKYHSTEHGNPIKGLLNKIHSIVTQPGQIGGLKKTICKRAWGSQNTMDCGTVV